jgi:hypothetical protein
MTYVSNAEGAITKQTKNLIRDVAFVVVLMMITTMVRVLFL